MTIMVASYRCRRCNRLRLSSTDCIKCGTKFCTECCIDHEDNCHGVPWPDEEDDALPEEMAPRPYQEECIASIEDQLTKTDSTIAVMATGLGKTVVFGHVAANWDRESSGRVLVLAHREELVYQAKSKLSKILGDDDYGGNHCEIEMAEATVNEDFMSHRRSKVVIASVQTLNSKRRGTKRMEKFNPLDFGLIITDEAHHATASTYRSVYAHFNQNPQMKHLGVTATPDRADEEALGQIYSSVAFEYGILEGVNDGWLVPISQQFIEVHGLDLTNCKFNKEDFNGDELARIMEIEENLHNVVYPTIAAAGSRPTLAFASSVAHAEKMAEIFNRHKPGSAEFITGTTPTELRRDIISRFSAGEFQYLCNCGIFLEGFDEPTVACVAMARPTKSRSLYAQCIGRGTRPLPGLVDGLVDDVARRSAIAASGKPDLLVLDFVGNSGKHKLINTSDILGGNQNDDVLEETLNGMREKSRKGEPSDVQEEIEAAKERIIAASQAKLSQIKPAAHFSATGIDPFQVFDVLPTRVPGYLKGKPVTQWQRATLIKRGVKEADVNRMDYVIAKQTIDIIFDRMRKGLCSLGQAKILIKNGYPKDTPFEQAKVIIDRIAKEQGWGKRR